MPQYNSRVGSTVGVLANLAARLPFYYGWIVVGAAAMVLFTAYGIQYSVGIFLVAIERDLGWTRAQLSLAFTLYALTYTTMSTVSGRLTDRWGPQRVVLGGGLLLALGLSLLSQVHARWQFYLFYSLIAGVGMSTVFVPCTTTVVRWFISRRGLALSLTTLGSSVGIFLVPLIVGSLVGAWGWRPAYIIVGVALFVVVFVVSPLLLRDPRSVGLGQRVAAGEQPADVPSLRLGQAVRTRNFWLFASGIIVAASVGVIPFVHLPSIVILDRGGSPAQGALASSLIGAGAIVGVLLAGPLSDRTGRRSAAVLMVALEAVAYLGLLLVPGLVHPFVFIFGCYYGASLVLMPAIAGDLFGRAHVGAVFGVIFAGIGWAGSLGVLGAGVAHDVLGSYELVFKAAIPVCLASMGLFLLLRMPQRR